MLKRRKGNIDIPTAFSLIIMVAFAAFLFTISKSESLFNEETLNAIDNGFIMKAFLDRVMRSSCVLVNNSIGEKKEYVVNTTFLKLQKDGERLPCIELDKISYNIDFVVYSNDMNKIVLQRKFNNTANESEKFDVFNLVSDNGLPVEMIVKYISYKDES